MANSLANGGIFTQDMDMSGTPFAKWADKEWIELGMRVAELDALAVHAR